MPQYEFPRSLALAGFALTGASLCLLTARAQKQSVAPAKAPRFSHSTEITNRFMPLSSLHQDIIEGKEDGHAIRVERTRKATTKTFIVWGQNVAAMVVEDREYRDAKLSEVTLDYFAQDDAGAIYYMGEDVNNYTKGKVTGHEGAWLSGAGGILPGVLVPAHPKIGDRFKSENVPHVTTEADEVVSLSALAKTPSGSYKNCLKIKETTPEGEVEYKYYAPKIGVVIEAPKNGDLRLKSHR